MRKPVILFVLLTASLSMQAQVKIGNNPGSINQNSILELESASKGFLPPRVTINDLHSVSPLTGTVPEGMTVYSIGGSVPDGYYTWNRASWLYTATSENLRSNHVLVKSSTDFPTAVGGVITLASNTTYEINGSISLSNKIDLNGCTIIGRDNLNDQLIYTGSSGELFTGSHGGVISNLILVASSSGAMLFNLDAGNAYINIVVKESYIVNCSNIGTIKNFGQTVYFRDVIFQNNTNGITFTSNNNLILINTLWDASNSNTYQTLTGTFNGILILGGADQVAASNSATGFDITGISSITGKAFLKSVLFMGDGTYIRGSFSNSWEVESSGINTEKDDIASGNLYISSSATTAFSASNTPGKIAGTTTAVSLFRVSSPSNNRLTYTGSKTRRFEVIASLSVSVAASNKDLVFYIAKNGAVLTESKQLMRMGSSQDKGSVTLSCTLLAAPNDYVEVWVANATDITSISVESMNLSIK